MDIKYLGHSSFQIKTKTATIITDPFDPQMVGLKYPKTEADIVTVSHHHPDHNKTDLITGNPLIIDWPGEFEKQNVRVSGYQSYHDKNKGADRGENTMFKIESEGISILHCGDLGHVPDEGFMEDIGEVHILLVPVGGFYTIDAQEAVKVVRKVEPSIVIPMHYNPSSAKASTSADASADKSVGKLDGLNEEIFKNIAILDTFLKEIGAENTEPQAKLIVKKEDLTEAVKVVVMDISS